MNASFWHSVEVLFSHIRSILWSKNNVEWMLFCVSLLYFGFFLHSWFDLQVLQVRSPSIFSIFDTIWITFDPLFHTKCCSYVYAQLMLCVFVDQSRKLHLNLLRKNQWQPYNLFGGFFNVYKQNKRSNNFNFIFFSFLWRMARPSDIKRKAKNTKKTMVSSINYIKMIF